MTKAEGPTTVAETISAVKSGRPRVGDLKSALGGEKRPRCDGWDICFRFG